MTQAMTQALAAPYGDLVCVWLGLAVFCLCAWLADVDMDDLFAPLDDAPEAPRLTLTLNGPFIPDDDEFRIFVLTQARRRQEERAAKARIARMGDAANG